MHQKHIERRIIRNAFYVSLFVFILTSLTSTIGSLVDGIVIGQFLGMDSIAAFGIISPLMIVFSLAGAIVSTGARNRFTKLIGNGMVEKANAVFSLSCILSAGIALLMMAAICLFATPFTTILGATGKAAYLLPKARAYLLGIAIGLPAMNLVRTLNAYMAIDNDRNLPIISSIAMTISDILFDLLAVMVFHGDTFEMGLATSLSYYIALVVLLMHFRKKNIVLKFSFKNIRWSESAGIVSSGLPAGICRIGNTLRSTFMNHMLAVAASAAAIAAYSVHRQADSFLNPLTIGMADTVAMIAGVLVGEENRPAIKRLLSESVRATFIITLGISVIAYITAPWFAMLYIKDDPEALILAISATRAYAIGMPFYGLNLIYLNYFQGIGKNILSSVSGFLLEAGFLMLSAGIMMPLFGADAVWYAFPVTQVLMFLYYGVVLFVEERRIGLVGKNVWERAMMLPESFDVADEDRLDCSVGSMEDVSELSVAAWNFCEAHGCDARRKYLISLSIEELAGNVVNHGFRNGKQGSIDIRILKKGDDYYVRFRDDCLIFDPVKQLTLYTNKEKVDHIGLRMTIGIAKDVQYTSVLKLNNLLLKL